MIRRRRLPIAATGVDTKVLGPMPEHRWAEYLRNRCAIDRETARRLGQDVIRVKAFRSIEHRKVAI